MARPAIVLNWAGPDLTIGTKRKNQTMEPLRPLLLGIDIDIDIDIY
jgi:hypothetical protein